MFGEGALLVVASAFEFPFESECLIDPVKFAEVSDSQRSPGVRVALAVDAAAMLGEAAVRAG